MAACARPRASGSSGRIDAEMTGPLQQIEIRPERPGDEEAIAHVHRTAFGGDAEARLVEAIRSGGDFDPRLSIVAFVANEIAGHILLSHVSIEGENRLTPALALAPMAVVPAMQRQGIGSALVRAGLDACRLERHGLVVVVGHPGYYPRFGFVEAGALGLHVPFPAPPEAVMVCNLSGPITRIGGVVRYPDYFLGLD